MMRVEWLFVWLMACGGATVPTMLAPGIEDSEPSTAIEVTDDGRPVVYGEHGAWCSIFDDNIAGLCGKDEADCNRLRSEGTTPHRYSKCRPWPAASCFVAEHRLTARLYRNCAPTIAQCDLILAEVRLSPDFAAPDRCGVYRRRQTK